MEIGVSDVYSFLSNAFFILLLVAEQRNARLLFPWSLMWGLQRVLYLVGVLLDFTFHYQQSITRSGIYFISLPHN